MKGIVVRIRRDGTVEAETVGIEGPACLDYIPVVERLCEARVVDSQFTPEFYAQETRSQDQTAPAERLIDRDEA